MRWKQRELIDDTQWRNWFAWYPVLVDGVWVWLEVVSKRREYSYCGSGDCLINTHYMVIPANKTEGE